MVKTTFLKPFAIATFIALGTADAGAQFSFANSNSLLSSSVMRSGCAITVVDVNNDGLDDILRMDQSTTLHLELQNMDGSFTHTNLGNISGTSRVWAMAAADVDHNGWKDVVTGANGACYLVKLFSSGGVVTSTTTLLSGSYFVQNITFGDIDNDGWVDVFVCDDNNYGKVYKNNSGTLAISTTMINTAPGAPTMYGSDPADSGNYGSVWTDFDNDGDLDLFVAHCRQSTSSSTDLRRKDRLFVNNGSGVYTEAASTYGIEVTDYKQTWTASFGDIDNDGDLDLLVTNHGEDGQIFENNGLGYFTELTGTGFTTSIDPIESILEDFDNDGYLDILLTGSNWYMWHNNGDKTFTPVTGGVFATLGGMLSFATGDLNHDGKIDLFSSYGNIYNSPSSTDNDVLYLNTNTNGNHYITFNLTGTASNHDAVGARATIYGPWGVQVREVRSGETYGTSNSMQLHFGLGANTTVDSARIDWPAGGSTTFGTLAADQFITVVEGGCTITGNVVPGPYAFCTGGSVTLTAASGYSSYLWSNGATTQSITSSSTGTYSVMVTSGACSNISPSVMTELNPDETPTVITSGANSCQGVATLTSSPAASYAWSGPGGFTASTQSINPPSSGSYTVMITGLCGNFSAAPTAVSITAAPAPTGTGAAGPGPASFNLTAAGTSGTLTWYDLPSAGTVLTTGTSYTTPVISSTTTYYVEESTTYTGATSSGGQINHTGTSLYSTGTTNSGVDFDVFSPCTLNTVKVYTITAGVREIQLKNSSGTVINSISINVPADTTILNLNFPLTPGTNYQLTTNGAVNTANFATTNPKFQRSSSGVSYPYNIGGLVSLTGSDQGPGYYYYFYDWKIQEPSFTCVSARTPVTATVTSAVGINSYASESGIAVYPNPASDMVNVMFGSSLSSTAVIELSDLTGRLAGTWSVENPAQGQSIQLNVSAMSAGTYFVTVKTGTQKTIQKLILTK